MAISKTVKDQKITIYCDRCFRDISSVSFLSCNNCKYDLCGKCFLEIKNYYKIKNGGNIFNKSNEDYNKIDEDDNKRFCKKFNSLFPKNHKYRIISNLNKNIDLDTSTSFTVLQELVFINGLINYGIGNFDEISLLIKEKSAEDVLDHFYERLKINNFKNNESNSNPIRSEPNDSEVMSFMSKRKDFESEIINDYEANISTIIFDDYENDLDYQLKEFMLNYYKTILKLRTIWRNYILDRNLINVTAIRSNDLKPVGIVTAKHRWALQYLSKSDFNSFVKGLEKEQKIKEKIEIISLKIADSLKRVDNFIGVLEKSLCEKLRLPSFVYLKIKILAVECFLTKKNFSSEIYSIFDRKDQKRVEILISWFQMHGLIYKL